jgi:hypothetical protein
VADRRHLGVAMAEVTHDTTSVDLIEGALERERTAFLAAFALVPPAQREVPPQRGGWSAVQIAEHVSRVEAGVAKMIGLAAAMPRTATGGELAEALLTPVKSAIVRDRGTKVNAPERTHPTGTLNAESVVARLRQTRAALLEAFRSADAGVLDEITMAHPFVGPLTMRALVALIADHDARHAEQLVEITESTT